MKKRILYIHHGKGLGGAPLSLLYLIESLDKEKFEPAVLFLHDSEAVDLYRSKNINIAGIVGVGDFPHSKIRWYRWYHLHIFLRAFWDTVKTRLFVAKKWLKKINPDLIHLNTSSLTAWAKVAKQMGIPIVFHIREPLANGYLGLRKKLIKSWVNKYSDVIIPISNNDAKPWFKSDKINIIHNPVDHKKFDKNLYSELFLKKYNLKKEDPKILFLGGLSKEKGTLQFLRIFEKLLKLLPETKLILAGYFDLKVNHIFNFKRYFPSQRYKLRVRKILKRLNYSIIFTGSIKEVEAAISVSDLLVSPSIVGHFSRPIIEAGFMSKPVIASKISPLDELMIHGQTGYLIDIKNKAAWVEKIFALITNKKLNQQMGDKAYDFCNKNFNIASYSNKIEKVYNKILDT
ncbi:glycosyltransferase [Candidatus Dependentiae bacterium]|nr:glycosyltransferase [Candidatus Dependentiae bacterium]